MEDSDQQQSGLLRAFEDRKGLLRALQRERGELLNRQIELNLAQRRLTEDRERNRLDIARLQDSR
jgi:hypothetical protein